MELDLKLAREAAGGHLLCVSLMPACGTLDMDQAFD